jgi:hypothetical protein
MVLERFDRNFFEGSDRKLPSNVVIIVFLSGVFPIFGE